VASAPSHRGLIWSHLASIHPKMSRSDKTVEKSPSPSWPIRGRHATYVILRASEASPAQHLQSVPWRHVAARLDVRRDTLSTASPLATLYEAATGIRLDLQIPRTRPTPERILEAVARRFDDGTLIALDLRTWRALAAAAENPGTPEVASSRDAATSKSGGAL